jgi:hypothetical protein
MQNFITIGSVVYERIEDKQTNKQTYLSFLYREDTSNNVGYSVWCTDLY